MSTIQEQDKWSKLGRVMASMDAKQEARIKDELKVKEICVDGLAKSTHMATGYFNLLKQVGFTSDEIYEKRCCVISGCPYNSGMFNITNHYIGYHNISIRNIAKLLPVMKADTRKPDTSLKNNFQTAHMTKD